MHISFNPIIFRLNDFHFSKWFRTVWKYERKKLLEKEILNLLDQTLLHVVVDINDKWREC